MHTNTWVLKLHLGVIYVNVCFFWPEIPILFKQFYIFLVLPFHDNTPVRKSDIILIFLVEDEGCQEGVVGARD